MIGESKPRVIMDRRQTLLDSSMKFALFDNPDFIIMKEAILAFERMIQAEKDKCKGVYTMNDENKNYLF